MSVLGPLSDAHVVTKLTAQDLDRARRFYRDKLGLEPFEEREGGLRFICAGTEFHLFSSSGTASGASTQIGFEVSDLKAVIEDLRRRGVTFEAVDVPGFEMQGEMVVVPNNYPSKGSGELGACFYDSEGNLLALGQEEVYIALRGSADVQVDGHPYKLDADHIIRVGPTARRKILPGPAGVRLLAIGGFPGRAYDPA